MPTSDEINPIKYNSRTESSSLGRTRPDGAPKSDKNFKRLVRNDEEPTKEQEEAAEIEEENETTPLSLFDLSAKNKVKSKSPSLLAKNGFPSEQALSQESSPIDTPEKPAPFFSTEHPDDKPLKDNFLHGEIVRESIIEGKKGKNNPLALDTDATLSPSKKDKSKLTRTQSELTEERADLSAINPQQSPIAFLAEKMEMSKEQKTQSHIKDIVAQIAEKMQVIKTGEKTDTVVTLRYPPIFEGATVTLTNFEGAKREFNIAFANLTDEGKKFLDRKIAEDSLIENLARQDIIVNVLTTTTLPQPNSDTEAHKYFTREEREQQRGQQQGSQDSEEEQG